ncbi:MAG: GDP-mannose 4,6-dehydratase [Planctomycetia bacterium]|nr:GDP-mannose 4,6-dehydratase [Planctomycetia bacterium]
MPSFIDPTHWQGTNVLITGGLGFIGSSLAIRLADLGAQVTLLDAMIPEYGGNLFNIEPVAERVRVNYGNICDEHAMSCLVRDQQYVFHLAGQVSHVLSLTNPYPDIEFNIKGTATVMEAVRRHAPDAKVIFTGTRGQYGATTDLPVNETASTNPRGIYEVSNLTAEKIILVYQQAHGINSVLLRLTNTYGPRAQMRHSHYGVANWFVRLVLDDGTIKVFGDGKIKRDFLYVDDCVEAILMSAVAPEAVGEVMNVGVDQPTNFLELAELLVELSGQGRWEFAPFSPERRAQEPGDFYSDISKIRRLVGWEPRCSLTDGLRSTLDYYRLHRDRYWQPEKVVTPLLRVAA